MSRNYQNHPDLYPSVTANDPHYFFTSDMTIQFGHHIVITDAEQQAIVNALAFYYDSHIRTPDADLKEQYQLAFIEDNRGCAAVEALAEKIATSN